MLSVKRPAAAGGRVGTRSSRNPRPAAQQCAPVRTGVSVAVHVNGNHWRALLPVDGEGRPVAVTARDERWTGAVAMAAAARWTREHDIA